MKRSRVSLPAALLVGTLLLAGCSPEEMGQRLLRDYAAHSYVRQAGEEAGRRGADYERAAAMARRAVELAPDNAQVVRQAGAVLLETRAWEDALEALRRLGALTGQQNLYLLGMAHLYRGDELQGASLLLSFLSVQRSLHATGRISDGEMALALNNVGYCLADAGVKLREALALTQEALRLWPDSPMILDSVGWAHFRLGEYRQAAFYLERALRLQVGGADPEILYHAGVVHARLGQITLARHELRRALELRRPFPEAEYEFQRLRWQLPPPVQAWLYPAECRPTSPNHLEEEPT